MSTTASTIGNQIDVVLPDSSQCRNLSRTKPETLESLLTAFGDDKQLPMLRTTARHIADCLGIPLDQVTVEALVGFSCRFTTFLEGRHHKQNAIRSYRNYAGVLLRKAKQLGWVEERTEIAEAWEPISAAMGKLEVP